MMHAVASDLTIQPDTVESLLYGNNPLQGVVGMDVDGGGNVTLFRRGPDGVRRTELRHRHFFLVSDDAYLADYDGDSDIDCLLGDGHLRYACSYESKRMMRWYLNKAIRNYGREQKIDIASVDLWRIPDILFIPDSEIQFLISSGIGQFKGMEFSDLRRMQIAINADMPWEQEHTSTADERIRLRQIALADSTGWCHVIDSQDTPEKEMLRQLVSLIGERDPDVIEGHDLFGMIFPILNIRFIRHDINFRAGREKRKVETYSTARHKDDRAIPFTNYLVPGRHVIDTLFLAEKSTPECLSDINPRDVAAVVAAVCGKHDRINNHDALARAMATSRISDTLLPAEFFQAQMVPIPLGKLSMAGTAKKIDYLMLRAYLHAGRSIPKPPKPETFEGGLCEQFIAGRCENVVKIDVESQYPSIMIGEGIKPESDSLDVFLPMLKKLTWLRMEAKMRRDSTSGPSRDRNDHLQKALKLLINSFYGYLGYRNARFADFGAAARVTTIGRAVMKKMIETLEELDCNVIQCDTDGAFFTPPFDAGASREQLANIVTTVENSLPQYLDIAVEGIWPAMLSLKKKNYALLASDGSVKITGGILGSGADEHFIRRALRSAAEYILSNDLSGLHTHLCSLKENISGGRLLFPDICITEIIRMAGNKYREFVADGGGKKPIYEAMMQYMEVRKGDRVFIVGNDVRCYRRDSKRKECIAFSFEFDPECPDYDQSHYLNRMSGALSRLNSLFTPEQFKAVFGDSTSKSPKKALKTVKVSSRIIRKTLNSGLSAYMELSSGFKSKKGLKRHIYVRADDDDAIQDFIEKNGNKDVYRSTFNYFCDRTPEKGITRFCPKSGDFIIELESETGDQLLNVSGALAAARHCTEVIENELSLPRDALTYFYNGGKSFYLSVSQAFLGVPDCVELNVIYEKLARHIHSLMRPEYQGAVDLNLYNHDRPLRFPGSVHPQYGLYNTRLTTDEFFSLSAEQIIRLAAFPREIPDDNTGEVHAFTVKEAVHAITKDIPRTEYYDPTRKPLRINMEKKNWHAKIVNYLLEQDVPVRIPCVETLTALIHSGGHTGFEGRVKLVTELRDAGKSEEEIIRIFMDSPHFHEKYFNDFVLPDTRPGDQRNGTGYMIRPDIWNDYSGISCSKCQEWCSPGDCYRNIQITGFDEASSPEHSEFRDKSREALRAALTEITSDTISEEESKPDLRINLIEAPMASGKTYQAVSVALDLASKGKHSLILAPDHTVCAEAVGMADGIEKNSGCILVHLVGKNENSCADIAAMLGPCSSCRCGVKSVVKKAPEFVEELLSSLDGIYSLSRMREMIGEMNKIQNAPQMCLRTLSMLIAPRANIIVAPFVFFIDRNLSGILGELPAYIFIDEGDVFTDQLMEYCRRVLTVALPRITNSGCMRSCRKPRCSHCKLSYSSVFAGGDMEPRARASESSTFGDPADFIGALEDALQIIRQEIRRGIVRRDIFDLNAIEKNIMNLRSTLKPKAHYFSAGETNITVEEHLRRENEALVSSPIAGREIVETGPVFGFKGEITKFPFVKLEKALSKPDEIQYDEEPPDHDTYPVFRFTVSSIYADKESYTYYKDGDSSYRNCINIFLKFAEFCEHAPGGALLRHVPRSGETESACKIVLSYMDDIYFSDLVFLLQSHRTALMSGTFIKLRMAAAVLLLKESAIRYYNAPVKMHNKATLVLHNSKLGDVYMSGDSRNNPVKPKVLNHNSFFAFFNYCIGLLGDGIHLYYFGKNKNAARALYDAYKRNNGKLLFKANLVNSNGDIVFSGGDEPLFQSNASVEEKIHLDRVSRMFLDNYRSSRSRGKNLPDFHLSIADGNGRANFDHFFDYVAAINRSTGQKITMGELLDYNRCRAVCQAMLRTPRDDTRKHLILYNGDMALFDVPAYLRNRVLLAEALYHEFLDGPKKEKLEELIKRFSPETHDAVQMLVLAAYFDEMINGDTTSAPSASPTESANANGKTDADVFSAFREAALLIPMMSDDVIDHIVNILRDKSTFTHGDRVGRKSDWLSALKSLVESGLLVKSKKSYDTIFMLPDAAPGNQVPESEGNPIE